MILPGPELLRPIQAQRCCLQAQLLLQKLLFLAPQ